jgi:hypothetical protein
MIPRPYWAGFHEILMGVFGEASTNKNVHDVVNMRLRFSRGTVKVL